jgi:ABC-type glycerol-3-phosphate transport system substrate-binding protein
MNFKRIAAMVIGAVMTLTVFTSCGDKTALTGGKGVPVASKENIYTSKAFTLTDTTVGRPQYAVTDGTYMYLTTYLMVDNSDDMPKTPEGYVDYENIPEGVVFTSQTANLVKTDLDGNVIAKTELAHITNLSTDYVDYSQPRIGADGKLYAPRMIQEQTQDEFGNYNYSQKCELIVFDENLNPSSALDITAAVSDKEEFGEGSYLYFDRYAIDKNGVFCFNYNNAVYGINIATGQIVYQTEEFSEDTWLQDMYTMPDGGLGICTYSYKITGDNYEYKMQIAPADTIGGTTGEPADFPSSLTMLNGDEAAAYYGYGAGMVYSFSADMSRTPVIDLLSSGIAVANVSSLTKTADGFILMSENWNTNTPEIFMLTAVDPAALADRKLIKVASLYPNNNLTRYIADFNSSHADYQAELVMYYDEEDFSISDAVTDFNTAILAGEIPDVVSIEGGMPYDSYVKKGMFADLYPLMEKDETIAKEDFVESILSALETDGKLYSLPAAFSVLTLIGRKDTLGDKGTYTVAELEAIAKSRDGRILMESTAREGFMSTYVYSSLNSFVNKETGEANFNSQEFIDILNFSKSFKPQSEMEDMMYDWNVIQEDMKSGKTLLQYRHMNDFRSLIQYEKGDYGTEIVFLGLPNTNGNSGITASLTYETAVTSKSKNPDGAWEFVKGLVSFKSPDYQYYEAGPLGSYPILKSELEAFAKKATEPYKQYNYQTGEYEEYENKYWGGGSPEGIVIPNNTDADNQRIFDLIDSVVTINRADANIQEIVADDMENFWNGSKSAEETAEIIQNRVSTYLAESA